MLLAVHLDLRRDLGRPHLVVTCPVELGQSFERAAAELVQTPAGPPE